MTPSESERSLFRDWGAYRRSPRRRPLARWLALALVLGLGAAAWAALRPEGWRPPSGLRGFSACTYGGYVSAWCGRVEVPADPRAPAGARTSLRVAVLPATDRPARGALVYLEGGPGRPATAAAVRVNEWFARVGRDRDLVMVDQRGSGGSGRLACPDRHVPVAEPAAVAAYLRRCFARLPGDPRPTTTSVAADDLEAVRRALGYGRLDLYGGSYGATLAQVYLRRHPRSVRSVVLDGAPLPGVRVYERSARNAERALGSILRRCAADAACRRAFPRPRQELAGVLARPPRRVTVEAGTFRIGPDEVAWTVAALTETAAGAAFVPYTIHEAAQGDYVPLARSYAAEVGRELDARARTAAFWVILCSEPWTGFDPAATARAAAGSYLAHAAVARARLFRRACGVVPKGPAPPRAFAAAPSPVPALLLAGGADPLDAVPDPVGLRRAFPNGRLVVVPAAGHGVIGYGCVQELVARFVARGSATGLDARCAGRVPPTPFAIG